VTASDALPPGARGPAPCRAACPVGTDAAAYVALIAEGRWAEGYDVARRPNPLASICGRICAAPCEEACRRGVVDAPIAIRALKRVLAEGHGFEAGAAVRWHRGAGPVPDDRKPSVGIVGAGPSGLSAAHDLRLAGHAVTLYERSARVGGMLTHGVPSFRLPRELIDTELDAIIRLGVTLRSGVDVGEDVSIEALLREHAAVLVGVGCGQGRLLETPGVDLPGVVRAIDFLRSLHAPAAGRATEVEAPVVVIGGGSVAFDAARSAWRIQGESDAQTMLDAARTAVRFQPSARAPDDLSVTLVAPEPRDRMSMQPEERERAEQEGIRILDQWGIRRVLGRDRIEGVELSPVVRLFDDQGRFAPELDAERVETIPARTLVLAVGQRSDTRFLAPIAAVETTPWGGVRVDAAGRTAHPRVYGAGDVTTGPRDLIRAIASGQTAAAAIAHDLAGNDRTKEPPPRAIAPPPVPSAPALRQPARYWTGYDAVPRVRLPLQPPVQRSARAEVEACLAPADAQREADRCLRCDEHLALSTERCITCGLCVDVCPYGCLAMESAGGRVRFVFDDATCIRCRLCVDRCPADALAFEGDPR